MKMLLRMSFYSSLFMVLFLATGCSTSQNLDNAQPKSSTVYRGVILDTVKAQKFDTGKMWTFDFPPLDYFEQTYKFRPTQEWLDDVTSGNYQKYYEGQYEKR